MTGFAQAVFWGDDMTFNKALSVNKRRVDIGTGKSTQLATI